MCVRGRAWQCWVHHGGGSAGCAHACVLCHRSSGASRPAVSAPKCWPSAVAAVASAASSSAATSATAALAAAASPSLCAAAPPSLYAVPCSRLLMIGDDRTLSWSSNRPSARTSVGCGLHQRMAGVEPHESASPSPPPALPPPLALLRAASTCSSECEVGSPFRVSNSGFDNPRSNPPLLFSGERRASSSASWTVTYGRTSPARGRGWWRGRRWRGAR